MTEAAANRKPYVIQSNNKGDKMARPNYVTDEHLEYLDELRESGITNMFGARPYLQRAFDMLDKKLAGKILTYWMESFGKPDR